MEGIIVKGIAGFYYVKTDDRVYQCKARGIFKKEGITPTVGDQAGIEVLEDGDGVINKILPRRNIFVRPAIANVDCFVIVTAAAQPTPGRGIIDKFMVMAEKSRTDIILCVNKADLAEGNTLEKIKGIYGDIYPVVFVSCKTGMGISELRAMLAGKKAALAGPSGVGKSSLLNAMEPKLSAETGAVSQKTLRGKHTTRHVEIFEMEMGGMIFDTPGFTSFDILEAEASELQHLYPEMESYIGNCQYDNCRHLSEPGCAIRQAVSQGGIKKSRYASYSEQLKEIIEKDKNRY